MLLKSRQAWLNDQNEQRDQFHRVVFAFVEAWADEMEILIHCRATMPKAAVAAGVKIAGQFAAAGAQLTYLHYAEAVEKMLVHWQFGIDFAIWHNAIYGNNNLMDKAVPMGDYTYIPDEVRRILGMPLNTPVMDMPDDMREFLRSIGHSGV